MKVVYNGFSRKLLLHYFGIQTKFLDFVAKMLVSTSGVHISKTTLYMWTINSVVTVRWPGIMRRT